MARRGKTIIDRDLCKGCYLCIRACPVKALEKDTEPNSTGTYPPRPVLREDGSSNCIACGNCWEVCPDVCVSIYEIG